MRYGIPNPRQMLDPNRTAMLGAMLISIKTDLIRLLRLEFKKYDVVIVTGQANSNSGTAVQGSSNNTVYH